VYFASNLDDSLHSLRIENLSEGNNTFFGNDECFCPFYADPTDMILCLRSRQRRLYVTVCICSSAVLEFLLGIPFLPFLPVFSVSSKWQQEFSHGAIIHYIKSTSPARLGGTLGAAAKFKTLGMNDEAVVGHEYFLNFVGVR
jgi:hypothetical protein